MQSYKLYIGLNDKKTKHQEISTINAYKITQNIIFANGVDGCTINEADGLFKHEDGTITTEKTLKVEIIGEYAKEVKNIIKELKKALNQEAILLLTDNVTSKLL